MLNRVSIEGRFVDDYELRKTNSGKSVMNFTIAVQNDRKNQEGNYDAEFFDVEAWNGTAEFCARNCHKGDLVVVDGRLKKQSWTDKATGQPRSKVVVSAVQVYKTSFAKKNNDSVEPSVEPFNPVEDEGNGEDYSQYPFN